MKPSELLTQGAFLGEEFLLWLWMRGLTAGGTSLNEDDTSACFLDDSILLVSEHGDVKRVALSKGNPAESQEAFEALSRGMRPVKAKVRMLDGELEWVFTLTAATLQIGALKLPPTSSKDAIGRLHDRLFLHEELSGRLERRLADFTRARSEQPDELAEELKTWIQDGASAPDAHEAEVARV